jgi:hypothetical protein
VHSTWPSYLHAPVAACFRTPLQAAYHEIAVRTFAHLHSLSLQWHISKRSGVVLRAMDRGIGSASTVVDNLFLRLVRGWLVTDARNSCWRCSLVSCGGRGAPEPSGRLPAVADASQA